MRISDWSSDVCSSDLTTSDCCPADGSKVDEDSAPWALSICGSGGHVGHRERPYLLRSPAVAEHGRGPPPFTSRHRRGQTSSLAAHSPSVDSDDRTSFVSGKTGSERVTIGGRRI